MSAPVVAGAELDELLRETPQAARRRADEAFARATGGRPVVLHGAGNVGRAALAALRSEGVEPLCFSDRAGGGAVVDGLEVLPLDEAAARHGAEAAFVVTIVNPGTPHREVAAALGAAGARQVVPFAPLAWRHAALRPWFAIDRPAGVLEAGDAVREAYALLAGRASRAEFVAQLAWRLTGDASALPPSRPLAEQYVADDLIAWRDDEAFVDVGAFDGDTVRALVAARGDRFARIVALEPEPQNLEGLRATVRALPEALRERVVVRPLAAAAEAGRMRFTGAGTSSAAATADGEVEVESARLDDVLGDEQVTFLKLDIEGAEPEALRGAAATIARDRPVLAVCVYHRQDHLWSLPLQVAGLTGDGYRFHLRRYAADFFETVLYAVPEERAAAR